MRHFKIKPGLFETKKNDAQAGLDLSKYVMDVLWHHGLVSTTDCCAYNLNGDITLTDAQYKIQFKNEGVELGNAGDVKVIDFVGSGIDVTLDENTLTITVDGSSIEGKFVGVFGSLSALNTNVPSPNFNDIAYLGNTAGITGGGARVPSFVVWESPQWEILTREMVGATTSSPGLAGLVTVPPAKSQNAFLRGDGDYSPSIPAYMSGVYYEDGDVVFNADDNKIYYCGTAHLSAAFNPSNWTELSPGSGASVMAGASASSDGVSGLVPTPFAGSENQFLKGNGNFGASIPFWTGGQNWEVGDIVYNLSDHKIYRVQVAHAGGAFNPSNFIELSPSSGSGSVTASIAFTGSTGGGAIVRYEGTSAPTLTKSGASTWTISVPSGTELLSIDIHCSATDNPGSTLTLNLNTASSVYNQGTSTMKIPIFSGVNLLSGYPANYPATTGATNIQIQVLSAPSSGDISLGVNNFTNGFGTGECIVKLSFT